MKLIQIKFGTAPVTFSIECTKYVLRKKYPSDPESVWSRGSVTLSFFLYIICHTSQYVVFSFVKKKVMWRGCWFGQMDISDERMDLVDGL